MNLGGIAIGDGTLNSEHVFEDVATLNIIETWPQLIGFDPVVYEYFKSQCVTCPRSLIDAANVPQERRCATTLSKCIIRKHITTPSSLGFPLDFLKTIVSLRRIPQSQLSAY